MTYERHARPTRREIRTRRIRGVAALAVVGAVAVALGHQLVASSASSSSSTSSWRASSSARVSSASTDASPVSAPRSEGPPLRGSRSGPGSDSGAVPDGTTVFDDGVVGVTNLEPALLGALRRAATDAALEGVTLIVDSGWRSPAYQAQLLRKAILKYGSEHEAARWVATPTTSAHVSGDAVDVGRSDATRWLSEHGAAYGLCQIYANEPWHYEFRPGAIHDGCPRMYADATYDPRTGR